MRGYEEKRNSGEGTCQERATVPLHEEHWSAKGSTLSNRNTGVRETALWVAQQEDSDTAHKKRSCAEREGNGKWRQLGKSLLGSLLFV